jgi:bifunctional DNA-binding transcriptional regulator/antitoxin component of YhaV-PrlF toxin-antitoxin module
VRQHLRLQPGDRVDFVIRDDVEVVVQPVGDVRA